MFRTRYVDLSIDQLSPNVRYKRKMQHWYVYLEWNEKLFREMFFAYTSGRSAKNPVDFWYEGEIGFFDYYVIPLSEKLRDCGVFGISSDENLSYAKANRDEWILKGRDVVQGYVEKIKKEATCECQTGHCEDPARCSL